MHLVKSVLSAPAPAHRNQAGEEKKRGEEKKGEEEKKREEEKGVKRTTRMSRLWLEHRTSRYHNFL
jgi:ribosomal protein L12E/L44/L45/RPP1/RPP2